MSGVYAGAFERVWARPELERKRRSVAVIAVPSVMQRWPQLRGLMAKGLNDGLTKEARIEIPIQTAFGAGGSRAVNAPAAAGRPGSP